MEKRIAVVDLDKTLFNCKSLCYTLFNLLPWNRNKKLKFVEVNHTATIKQSKANKIFRLLNPKFYFTYPDAVETINELSELGYEVHFVSNRPNIRPVVALTLLSLENHGLKYDKLVLGCTNKEEYAKSAGVDYLIDNTKTLCKSLAKNTSVKPLCFKPALKREKGREKLSDAAFSRFSSWAGIREFFRLERKVEEKAREEQNASAIDIRQKAAKNFISRGLCLPEPQKAK